MLVNQEQIKYAYKYHQIEQFILKDIQKGKYLPNTKTPSLKDLMEHYKVSYSTAAHVIRNLVEKKVLYTVPSKGCFVSELEKEFSKKSTQDNLNRNKKIVFISPQSIEDEYYYKIQLGALDVIQAKGYEFVIYNSEFSYNKEIEILGRCYENPPAGIIFVPVFNNMNYKHLFHLKKRGVNIVTAGSDFKNNENDWVGVDGKKAMKTAIKYLIKTGHRKIALLGVGEKKITSTSEIALQSYKEALKEAGIKIDPELILDYDTDVDNIGKSGHKGLKELLKEKIKFTAVFAVGDEVAVRAYRILKEKGKKVPDDISLMGFNDLDVARDFEVPLTTIRHDIYNTGSTAAKLLLERIDNSLYQKTTITRPDNVEKIFLKTKLIIRDSIKKI